MEFNENFISVCGRLLGKWRTSGRGAEFGNEHWLSGFTTVVGMSCMGFLVVSCFSCHPVFRFSLLAYGSQRVVSIS